MKKIVLTAILMIAFLVLSGSSCDKALDSVHETNTNAVSANTFVIITDYEDWINGNVIYYLYCTDTDVMYAEYSTSGYTSAFVPIYKPDGTLLKYSEWSKER